MEPYKIGTVVRYRGSKEHMHGEYRVTGHGTPGRPGASEVYTVEELAGYYPDGVSYDLWPVGVPHKFGERDKALYYVRRESITPVERTDAVSG